MKEEEKTKGFEESNISDFLMLEKKNNGEKN